MFGLTYFGCFKVRSSLPNEIISLGKALPETALFVLNYSQPEPLLEGI